MTTNLAAAASTLVALVITWMRYGKPDVSMTLNGSLAGLVGITAGCDVVSNYGAIDVYKRQIFIRFLFVNTS